RHMISLGERTEPNVWRPPVLKTVAAQGEGVDEVMGAIGDHFAWMEGSGALRDRRVRRAVDEIEAIAIQALRARIGDLTRRVKPPRVAPGAGVHLDVGRGQPECASTGGCSRLAARSTSSRDALC